MDRRSFVRLVGGVAAFPSLAVGVTRIDRPSAVGHSVKRWPAVEVDGDYHYYASTFDGTDETFYVDGREVSSW